MNAVAKSVEAALPTTVAPWSSLQRAMTRLASDSMLQKSLVSIVDQAAVSGTNFAITILLGRLCGKPEVGLYYLALQAVFFARGVQEQLISSPYLVYASRRRGREATTFAGSNLVHELGLL